MPRIRLFKLVVLSLFLFSTLSVLQAVGQDAAVEKPAEVDPVHPDRILVTGAVELQLPAFHDDDLAGVKFADLFDGLPGVPGEEEPAAGSPVRRTWWEQQQMVGKIAEKRIGWLSTGPKTRRPFATWRSTSPPTAG